MLCSEPHGYRTATLSWKFHVYSHQFASRNAEVCGYWDLLKYLFGNDLPHISLREIPGLIFRLWGSDVKGV